MFSFSLVSVLLMGYYGRQTPSDLKQFDWILHTWRTTDSTKAYHKWIKINDTLYRSFLIEVGAETKIRPGYSLYNKDNNIFLALDDNSWMLRSAEDKQFTFKRLLEKFPEKITWEQKDKKWQFDLIMHSLKDQTQLYIYDEDNYELDHIIKDCKKNNPGLF